MSTTGHRIPSARRDPWLRWAWQARDVYPWLTRLGVAGLLTTALMAAFGLPPVDLHGVLHRFGVMDPGCGGTRAAWYTARGEWSMAWRYNPLGIVAVLGSAGLVLRAVVGVSLRRWVTVTVAWTPARTRAAIVIALVLLGSLAVRQQLRADLLMAGT